MPNKIQTTIVISKKEISGMETYTYDINSGDEAPRITGFANGWVEAAKKGHAQLILFFEELDKKQAELDATDKAKEEAELEARLEAELGKATP